MEVEHVFLLEADITAEVFADNALPSGEEGLIKDFLKLLRQVVVLELARALCLLLHELDSFQSHVCNSDQEGQRNVSQLIGKLMMLTFIDV